MTQAASADDSNPAQIMLTNTVIRIDLTMGADHP
jgi:hypothetical protein